MEQDYKKEMCAMTEGLAEWCHRRKRRLRTSRTLIGFATAIAIVVIGILPTPDGLYISNTSARTATLGTINKTIIITSCL